MTPERDLLPRVVAMLPKSTEPGLSAKEVRDALRITRDQADSLLKRAGRLGIAWFAHPRKHGRRLGGWRRA